MKIYASIKKNVKGSKVWVKKTNYGSVLVRFFNLCITINPYQ